MTPFLKHPFGDYCLICVNSWFFGFSFLLFRYGLKCQALFKEVTKKILSQVSKKNIFVVLLKDMKCQNIKYNKC